MKFPRTLTIAGSASQGSAGVQADLKTFQELNVYGMSAITAFVATNQTLDQSIFTQSLDAVKAQVYSSLEHVGADAVKTGMLFTEDIIKTVAVLLEESGVSNIVVDPVMIGKMGSQLLKDEAVDALINYLLPSAKILTPNVEEAGRILHTSTPESLKDMEECAYELHKLGPEYILIKGGALKGLPAIDVMFDGNEMLVLEEERVATIHTSGAGCTYSAAITAQLAKGDTVEGAVRTAKAFVTQAIRYALDFNRGLAQLTKQRHAFFHRIA
ncbi:bifunctional hydroxymethylpyrimidine kinase/phosphomethylpyrimidine kinase [Halobacillus salinarum]|uniref:Hydroxymethylpyrimidine/phosphomethylpyrimidine kinase n=1 Tax=Halobacillus salinarum TaxID=2932257 RepID=A0ABY4EM20_9BACI|nr:bifunctional hydroxymethylpyrimidine kinase/phosphomethylpyrimidine kinase [Halobacillus salinarum]UOQ45178.1 bifunctional hydroxymethylpyrimidine kinase/phosphomethylpyrimidine kinase [Halobacillus salinarum]